MSEQKKPEAGEFWDMKSTRLLIVGTKRNGAVVAEYECGTIGTFRVDHHWQHLPDCDSFEWQPETFPQYIVYGNSGQFADCAYIVRESPSVVYSIKANGSRGNVDGWADYKKDLLRRGVWKQVTQAEAESCVKKPEPVESPDDWVTQDRVPDRPGIDEWRRVFNGIPDEWKLSGEQEQRFRHGHTALHGQSVFEVRCRRRDLPPLPEETPKREYVRLWVDDSGTVFKSRIENTEDTDRELKHDGTGFYLEDAT